MTYLLGLTIGPVQSYIEESRKLLDLRNSSKIISDIIACSIKIINEKDETCKIVYPTYQKDYKGDFSNYIIFEITKQIDLTNLVSEIHQICALKDLSFNEFNDIFHIFWAIEPMGESPYIEAFKRLNNMLSSIKNTYVFEQCIQTSRKKCSLCGKRNETTSKMSKSDKETFKITSGEYLCNQCLCKRTFHKNNLENEGVRFNSIYSTAIYKWKKENECKLLGIKESLNKIFDGDDKYYNLKELENVINTKNIEDFKDKSEITIEDRMQQIKAIHAELTSLYNDVSAPNYEYAFIQFDIDQLGLWMNGNFQKDKAANLRDQQEFLSKLLLSFGVKLKEKLCTECEIIYSGGDDFLGVLCNENIENVIVIIESEFETEVRSKLVSSGSFNSNMTYSTSVVIAPCKIAMKDVLRKCRSELLNVKKKYEKNSVPKNGIVFNYIINESKEKTCMMKQTKNKEFFNLVRKGKTLGDKISFSYINKFEEMLNLFNCENLSHDELLSLGDICRFELSRMMRRSLDKNSESERYILDMVNYILDIFVASQTKNKNNEYSVETNNMIGILIMYEKFVSIK